LHYSSVHHRGVVPSFEAAVNSHIYSFGRNGYFGGSSARGSGDSIR
jgi:hypothetical protein